MSNVRLQGKEDNDKERGLEHVQNMSLLQFVSMHIYCLGKDVNLYCAL